MALCSASTVDWYLLFVAFWLAAHQGWSGSQIAVLVVAGRGPTLLGGVLGGRAVDVFGPRALMLVDAAVRGSLCLVLVVSQAVGDSSYWLLCVVLGGCAVSSPLSYAAARTMMPELVDATQVTRANTALSLGDQLPIVVSALVAGPLLTAGGWAVFGVPVVLLLVVGLIAWQLPRIEGRGSPVEVRVDAPTPVWRLPSVVALIGLSTAYFFVYGPFQPLLPVLIEDNLHGSAATYSLMRVLLGLGALAGLGLAPFLSTFDRPGVVNAIGAVLYGLVLVPMVLTHTVWVACVIYTISGVVWGPYAAVEATALLHWTPAKQRGQVFGWQRGLIITAIPLGGALGSLALNILSVQVILCTSALACSLIGLVALATPAIRRRATPP